MSPAEATASEHFDLTRYPDLLKGDVAVVTGAAQGNGEAIAQGLASCGAKIAVVDRDEEKLAAVVNAIKAVGGQAVAYHLDVADMAACQKMAASVERDLGAASVLVNNAGIVRRVTVEEEGFIASIQDQFLVNTLGSAHLVKAFLIQLTATKGRVINIGSIASFAATTGGIGYGASKGAVLLMTKTMAVELAPLGIRVNGIAPGLMVTPMTAPTRNKPEAVRQYMDHIPMKRFGDAGELIGPVLFLASQLSSYVTGVMLPVDGGYLTV